MEVSVERFRSEQKLKRFCQSYDLKTLELLTKWLTEEEIFSEEVFFVFMFGEKLHMSPLNYLKAELFFKKVVPTKTVE